jgi:hypothetical protein
MSVLENLASAQGRRDEVLNEALAKDIVAKNDVAAVKELVGVFAQKTKADTQSDSIKVLYEIGKLKPTLIADYTAQFVPLLESKNNRLQWGSMMALAAIAQVKAADIYAHLPKILAASDSGSVITRDYAVQILIELGKNPAYADTAFTLLIEQLTQCPTNQLPMYAENALPIITPQNKSVFIKTLTARLPEIDKDSKRKRVEASLKKADKK